VSRAAADPPVDFPSARIADWSTAVQIGKGVAGPGPEVAADERRGLRDDVVSAVADAERWTLEFTDLSYEGAPARAWVMGRGTWIRRNTVGLQRMMEPLATRLLEERPDRSSIARKALGGQIGAILGYVSRRVLGQFDVFVPPDDDGVIYFVGPNIIDVERRYGLPPEDFRRWIAIHEVTHRIQFAVAPWLRGYLGGLVEEYLSTVSLDATAVKAQLMRAVEEIRAGRADLHGAGGILLLLTPEQRAVFEKTQAMMSLLEGHASYVMNEVARDHVRDVDLLRRALTARRQVRGIEKAVQRAIAFDQKVAQYDAGERFVREVVARAGQEALNHVWAAPANLPSRDEVAEPGRWVARVGA
jgi:coenzyme F420 biosynthesis associated uncharacterized protein